MKMRVESVTGQQNIQLLRHVSPIRDKRLQKTCFICAARLEFITRNRDAETNSAMQASFLCLLVIRVSEHLELSKYCTYPGSAEN